VATTTKQISAEALITDKMVLDGPALREKYSLSEKQLESVFKMLKDRGDLFDAKLGSRVRELRASLQIAEKPEPAESLVPQSAPADNKPALPQSNTAIEPPSNTPWSVLKRFGVGFMALAYKLGPKIIAGLSKFVKGLKLGKVGLAGTSMAAYSCLFTWQFALLIMIALFVHESGHLWAMKRYGMKTKGIYFIPLLGGAAVADDEFPSRAAESYIALMGPAWGLLLTVPTALLYFVTENPIFAAAAGWMAMVNLFNLLPISPLDGGRVFKSIAFSLRSVVGLIFLILGLIIASILAVKYGMGLFFLLLIVGGIELAVEFKRRVEIPKMAGAGLLYSVMAYVVIAGLLWALLWSMKHVPAADIAMNMFQTSGSILDVVAPEAGP
jgi:Zn-dependent protease